MPPPPTPRGFARGFWSFINVVSLFGCVGGALATLLGLVPAAYATYAMCLPLVLPIVSLAATMARERVVSEDAKRQYAYMGAPSFVAEGRQLVEELRRELRAAAGAAAAASVPRTKDLDAKLASLEGSVLSAGRAAREAAAAAGVKLPEALARESRGQFEAIVMALRQELARAMEASRSAQEVGAMAELKTRLFAVEGALAGLEVTQSEGIRRLSMSISSAISDAESTLQAAVRNEVSRSIEPVRRLPEMLATALPAVLPGGDGSVMGGGGGGGAVGQDWMLEAMRSVLAAEVGVVVQRVAEDNADALARMSQTRSVMIDEQQWETLGRRLRQLESLVTAPEWSAQLLQLAASAATPADLERTREELSAEVRSSQQALKDSLQEMAAAVEGVRSGMQVGGGEGARGDDASAAAAAAAAAAEVPAEALQVIAESLEGVGNAIGSIEKKLASLTAAVAAGNTAAASSSSAAEAAGGDGKGEGEGEGEAAAATTSSGDGSAARQQGVVGMLVSQQFTDVLAQYGELRGTLGETQRAIDRVSAQLAALGDRLSSEIATVRSSSGGGAAADEGSASSAASGVWAPGAGAASPSYDEDDGSSSRVAQMRSASYADYSPTSPSTPPLQPAFAQPMAPSPPQQQQQLGLVPAAVPPPYEPPSYGGGFAPPMPPPQLQLQLAPDREQLLQEVLSRDVGALAPEAAARAGLAALRRGREETYRGADLGLAEALVQHAVDCFGHVLQLQPANTKAAGNLGNALLAQGELQRVMLDELVAGPPPGSAAEAEAQAAAVAAKRTEASVLLTRAGDMFRQVLEREEWSSRALVNWGRAMVMRGELADDPAIADRLYEAAINKFEAVLEEEGAAGSSAQLASSIVAAKYRCGLAMKALGQLRLASGTGSGSSREVGTLLQDAANYLADVLADRSQDAQALWPPAGEALAECQQQLAVMGTARQRR